MKCPKCNHVQGKSVGSTCTSCRRSYVFFPPSKEITDQKMHMRIAKVTRNDTYAFTPRQLESLWVRLQHRTAFSPITLLMQMVSWGMFWLISGEHLMSMVGLPVFPMAAVVAAVGFAVLLGVALIRHRVRPLATPEPAVRGWLMRWCTQQPTSMLVSMPSLGQAPVDAGNPQFDHGVERMLIVDCDELVDFFVKSGLHAEQRCLVVSMTGYPTYLRERAQRVIDDTNRPIFLLHGTDLSGRAMAERSVFELAVDRFTDLGLTWPMVARHAGLCRMVEAGATEVRVDHLLPMELVGAVALCMDRNAPLSSVTDEEAQPEADFGMFLLVDAFG